LAASEASAIGSSSARRLHAISNSEKMECSEMQVVIAFLRCHQKLDRCDDMRLAGVAVSGSADLFQRDRPNRARDAYTLP
jgi:hypothetical protein